VSEGEGGREPVGGGSWVGVGGGRGWKRGGRFPLLPPEGGLLTYLIKGGFSGEKKEVLFVLSREEDGTELRGKREKRRKARASFRLDKTF